MKILKTLKAYRFYKYRTCYSWGLTEWKIVRLPIGTTPKSFFDEMSEKHSCSDKFQYVEWKKVVPPANWLEQEIIDLRNQAKTVNQLADDYCWILHKIEHDRRKRSRKTA